MSSFPCIAITSLWHCLSPFAEIAEVWRVLKVGHTSDFDTLLITHNGISRTVYRKGTGPIVIILPEIPGLHTSTFELARKIADHDFSVYLLSLFGEDNKPFRYRDAIKKMGHVCINREFAVLAGRRSSPIINWIRSFCGTIQSQSNFGIGLIGMCITGNFALGLLAEPWMLAPVLSQPSLPIGKPSGLHVTNSNFRICGFF